MKHITAILMALSITAGCSGQQQKPVENTVAPDSSINAPQTDIKVKREYDENGNLIRYDSVYTSYYSSSGDSIQIEQFLQNMEKQFNQSWPFKYDFFTGYDSNFDSIINQYFYNNPFFDDPFFNSPGFYGHDLFHKRWQQIDSLRKQNLRDIHPQTYKN